MANPFTRYRYILLWQLAHFDPVDLLDDSLEDSVWGPNADPSGRGFTNLLCYALGISPYSAKEPFQVKLRRDGSVRFDLTFNAEATDVGIELQRSENLQTWTNGSDATWAFRGVNDGLERWTLTVPKPAGSGLVFFRFVVGPRES